MTRPGLMIFAAGRGTRMLPLTADRPKPLIRVAGRPLIDFALDIAEAFGPARTVVNTHTFADQMAAHLDGRGPALSHEPELLDTGGGLRAAQPLLPEGPVMTLNSDALWAGPNPLALLWEAWDPARMKALLLLLAPEARLGHKRDGDFRLAPSGRLTRGGPVTYSGAQILQPDPVRQVAEPVFSLNLVWDDIAARDGLYGLLYPGRWCDVGHPQAIPLAEGLLQDA